METQNKLVEVARGDPLTEATANFLVNRRMNKSQQMRWTRRGSDLLLQVRSAVYNALSTPSLTNSLHRTLVYPNKSQRPSDPKVLDSLARRRIALRKVVGRSRFRVEPMVYLENVGEFPLACVDCG